MTRVIITPHAENQASAVDEWWRANRSEAPELFTEELARGLALVAGQPEAGTECEKARWPGVRRLLLRRSQYHVYYEYDVAADLVRVVSVWGAVRGQGPDLRLLLRR